MIKLFKDANLTSEVSVASPKRFLLPLDGGTRTSSLWLGDPYTATLKVQAAIGVTSVTVDQTFEFLSSGQAMINGITITYTGKTGTTLTGIPAVGVGSITSVCNVGSLIRPKKTYTSVGNISAIPTGFDLNHGLKVSLKRSDQSSYAFPGTPVVYAVSSIETGVTNAIRVDIQVEVEAGAQQEFTSWDVLIQLINPLSEHVAVSGPGYVLRRDQDLQQKIRLFPLNREIQAALPGFIVGQHRWRDKEQLNAGVLVPTQWDPDVAAIGEEKFVSGFGHGGDLEALGIEEVDDSLYVRINHGAYFSGPNRYYLPADHELEFFPVSSVGNTSLVLKHKPRLTRPVFVGTYKLDGQGFYEKDVEYRYMSDGLSTDDGASPYQFTLDRATKTIVVNTAPAAQVLFLGTLSGKKIDYFDLSSYPVDKVKRIFVDRGLGKDQVNALNWTFDRELGTVVVTAESGTGPSIIGGLAGEAVFAEIDTALAVLYEFGDADTRLITEVDVNPAFSGVSGGHFYLQHRRQKPDSIELSVDKPLIQIPPTFESILGLSAYGPVYFGDDYALLIARAFSKVPGEVVPGARLSVVVDPSNFSGLINYTDPLTSDVEVVTGSDGVANLVYTPKTGFGVWVPTIAAVTPVTNVSLGGKKTTTITNDTLVLPSPVPISQVRNTQEGWLVTLYSVFNTNPLFGLVGGVTSLGEIPFATTGTPGATDYQTNGMRDAWRSGEAVVRPIQALDINGNNYTSGSFNGMVKQLVFSAALPNASGTAAYFVTYLQRVTIKLDLVGSNISSNTILLQMEVPSVIVENPWLVIEDDTQGRINQYRLGWTRPISTQAPAYIP